MKKRSIAVVLSLALGLTSFQGCIGSFGLTGKLYNFNKSLGDKWIQELGFLALLIVQIYTIAFLVDVVVLNSIQFWTGTNPVAMQPGEKEVRYVKGETGLYKIEAAKNRFHIEQVEGSEAGESVDLVYDQVSDTWSISSENRMRTVVQFSADTSVARILKPDGRTVSVKTGSNPDELYRALGL